ncbi:2009_t:CDS:2, partial [Entrophospora sp. SA101]
LLLDVEGNYPPLFGMRKIMEIGLPLIKDEIDKNLRILGAFISSDQTSQAEDNDNDTNDDIISFNPKNNQVEDYSDDNDNINDERRISLI